MDHPAIERIDRPFFTPGTFVLLAFMVVGFSFGLARFLLGLETVTNLDNYYPWGIWIAIDVACGVALAAGGFTTAALIDIFGRKKYHALLRPAILTAWLGYLMVAIGLQFDVGRYWNIWRPLFNWQGNSGLFEVAMCVMFYLTVLTIEMSPALLEGLRDRIQRNEWGARLLSRVEQPIITLHRVVKTVLPIFIIAGVVLSFMHQSSLGTIILIAPTKVHALWYTPWLPLLFLLSAIMVGFPMVILESILANRGFRRELEMDILTPLARYIPWFIGIYALFKFGDFFYRLDSISLTNCPRCTTAFIIEVFIGIVLPFVLLTQKAVRRSSGWLFFSVLLIILGVVLNRINVYLVGYTPPYTDTFYFPSLGEIALTVALTCSIMFLYRLVVTFFPVFERCRCGRCRERYEEEARQLSAQPLTSTTAWVLRGGAALLLVSFVVIYAVVHQEAVAGDIEAHEWVQSVQPVKIEQEPLPASSHANRPESYRNLYVLNYPLLNERTDFYEPVKFTHRTHDVVTQGNCGVCHHRFSFDEEDRVGMDIEAFHVENLDERIDGIACGACHDMNEITIQKCSSCHLFANEDDDPDRLGLKGAYHRQCIGCHEDQAQAVFAPVDCTGCHHPLTPDHRPLVKLGPDPSPTEVTAQCLTCHSHVGQDILKTAHWNWAGHSAFVKGHEHQVNLGKKSLINNCTLGMAADDKLCATCHIGYGLGMEGFDFSDPNRIDCLVCHDTTGVYRKTEGGLPAEGIDLAEVAARVGRPSRRECGACHFNSGGGSNFKHGDLEPILVDAPDDFDVHMGKYDLRCQDCHTTRNHRIAGMSLTAPAFEGRVQCVKCHSDAPHGISGPVSRHLDDHVRSVACETCHIPSFAKNSPTRVHLDFSQVGQDRQPQIGPLGQPDFDKKIGGQEWAMNVVPTYLWYDGTRRAYVMGDKIDPDETVVLNQPLGDRREPSARIYPFKVHTAEQPYDTERKILAVPKLHEGLWEHYDWGKALTEGMQTVGLEYSGSYGFVRTKMYVSIHHEVAPTRQSLGCADCHRVEAISCGRCHTEMRGQPLPEHASPLYPDVKERMDFKALGYEDDPALIGGRFYIGPGRGRPQR